MESEPKINKLYLWSTLLLMLVLPCISIITELYYYSENTTLAELSGKWFIFWAVGLRLLIAGIRQVTKPAFTAKTIFHIDNEDSFVLVRELGFANICFGLMAIISLFLPEWRMAAAFAGGLFFGIAGINHIIKKPAGPDETLAMISDLYMLVVMALYLMFSLR